MSWDLKGQSLFSDVTMDFTSQGSTLSEMDLVDEGMSDPEDAEVFSSRCSAGSPLQQDQEDEEDHDFEDDEEDHDFEEESHIFSFHEDLLEQGQEPPQEKEQYDCCAGTRHMFFLSSAGLHM
eukprot:CAMPEP_0115072786 /NCGR_PEP_ID=MMETSP0227-20121206/14423_1 /TAXON_ID=89957 /ORGANISM="Polarella glacialis, Strain CCMP 1383" /LENGTH=121 /DNA_ID=CAMNT_0002459571 /DNA_START=160 /DNA_END=525 /DNA_ORIENTATION=-